MAKKASKSSGSKYTKPQLRQKLKEEVKEGDKGGKKGQWSARKSQLLAQKYRAEGGGYEGDKGAPQKSIDKWTDEKWTTEDGSPAQKGDKTDRYLPKKAWDDMTPAQKKATKKKKQEGSKSGKQFVDNTGAAKKSRKKATKKSSAKKVTKKAAAKKKAKKTTTKKTAKKTAKKSTAKKTTKKSSSKKTASKKTSKKTAKKTGKKVVKKAASKKKVGRPRKTKG